MDKYSIKEVSEITGISIHSLRYYDKIGLLVPKREENKYRYYNNDDILLLKYIMVMKYGGMSLQDIKVFLNNKSRGTMDDLYESIQLLDTKLEELSFKIKTLENIYKITEEAKELLYQKKENKDNSNINKLIITTYDYINKKGTI